jgi:hypothetical protein
MMPGWRGGSRLLSSTAKPTATPKPTNTLATPNHALPGPGMPLGRRGRRHGPPGSQATPDASPPTKSPAKSTTTTKSNKDKEQGGSNQLIKRTLHIRRVARVNSGGKVRSVAALVVVGDGKGYAGFGEGRGMDTTVAIDKATLKAQASMRRIERFDGRTLFSDVDHSFHSVRLKMKAAAPGG